MIRLQLENNREIQLFYSILLKSSKVSIEMLEDRLTEDNKILDIAKKAHLFNTLALEIQISCNSKIKAEKLEVELDTDTALVLKTVLETTLNDIPNLILKIDSENIKEEKQTEDFEIIFKEIEILIKKFDTLLNI
jgi:hypothetical protein